MDAPRPVSPKTVLLSLQIAIMEVLPDGILHDIEIGGLPHFFYLEIPYRESVCFAQMPDLH